LFKKDRPKFIGAASKSCKKEIEMKGNIKRLAVFVMIAGIAMFIAVPMASANDFWWKTLIRGEYAFTGSGACTLAPGGFDINFKPKPIGPNGETFANMGPNFWEGVYTFNYGGKGKMDALQRYNDGPNVYDAGLAHLSWEFEYEMDGSEITFRFIPHSYLGEYLEGPNAPAKLLPPNNAYFDNPYTGRISPDGMTLFVFFGVPMKITIPEFGPPGHPLELVCNGVHQGFKKHW